MAFSFAKNSSSVNINNHLCYLDFSRLFTEYIEQYYSSSYSHLVFLCIGTDRSTGDSLGPLIGYKLEKPLSMHEKVYVYGTLDEPVHAKNLKEYIDKIYSNFEKPFIVAIDACLGKVERVGYITVGSGPISPGAGVNKNLPAVGDLHIMGIVNLGGYMEYMILQNTRLSLVMKMADAIAEGIKFSLWKINKEKLLS